jgi:hypothetical protein
MDIGPSADPLAGGIDLQALHREPHQQADQIRSIHLIRCHIQPDLTYDSESQD